MYGEKGQKSKQRRRLDAAEGMHKERLGVCVRMAQMERDRSS